VESLATTRVGGDERRWGLVTRLEAPRVAWAVLAMLLAGTGAVLLYETRGTTLWFDEWMWALDRRGNDLDAFLQPHNGHLSLVPIGIYRVLFATAGLDHYWPYRVVVIGAHLACVALVFSYASRRLGGFLGLLAASLVLFLGPAFQNILWPFQVGWLVSLGAGIGALLMLDRNDRAGDLWACVLLSLSLASSGLGLAIVAGVLVELVWGRRRWQNLWIVAVPIVLYVPWWLHYQDSNWIRVAKASGIGHPVLNGILQAPGFVANSAGAALSALLGLGGQTGLDLSGPGTFLVWGPALVIAAVAVLLRRLARPRPFRPRVLALLAMALTFWALTAISRGFISQPYTSRYLYVGGLLIVLVAVELAAESAISQRVAVVLALGVVAIAVSNAGAFRDGGRYLRTQAQITRAQVTALDIARPVVEPRFVANAFFGLVAGPYFAAERAIGSPAVSPEKLATEPEPVRQQADGQLVRMHRPGLRSPPVAAASGSPPRVDTATGGGLTKHGSCLSFRRAGFTASSTTGEVRVTVPRTGVLVMAQGGSLAVGVRRFADEFQPLGTVAPGASASLRIRPDLAPQPWHLSVTPTERAMLCGLG
jgi:hypothetical protein